MLGNSKAGLILALLLAAAFWFYVQRILIPHQVMDATAHEHPRGNLSDLYPRWLGARELLLHGRDPYSAAVTREIQIGYYGRAIDSAPTGDPEDQQAFAYPAYIILLLAPTVGFPFTDVSAIFFWILWLLSAGSVLLWVRVFRWKLSKSRIAIILLLYLSCVPFVQGVKLEQFTLLVAALLAVCAHLLVTKNFLLAGICLALASIKPQLVLALVAWLIVWGISDWHRRKNFVWGFAATMAVLFSTAEWILQGWIKKFVQAVRAYEQYTHAASLFDNFIGAKFGTAVSVAVALIAAVICWRLRRESEQSSRFVFAFALVLAVTLVIIPTISTYNQVLLLPAVLLLVLHASEIWRQNRLSRIVFALAAAAVAWPWIAALSLAVASFILPAATVQRAWALPFYTNIASPLAILGLMFQYSFRAVSTR